MISKEKLVAEKVLEALSDIRFCLKNGGHLGIKSANGHFKLTGLDESEIISFSYGKEEDFEAYLDILLKELKKKEIKIAWMTF